MDYLLTALVVLALLAVLSLLKSFFLHTRSEREKLSRQKKLSEKSPKKLH